jgi:hypothetical protein
MSSQATRTDTTNPTRRALLAGAPAALAAGTVNGLAIAAASPSAADPIFAVIADHRASVEAYCRASEISGSLCDWGPDKDPGSDAAEAVTQETITRMPFGMCSLFNPQRSMASQHFWTTSVSLNF